MKQQSVLTHRYIDSLETENNLTDPHKTIQDVKFLRKYKDKQLFGGKKHFDRLCVRNPNLLMRVSQFEELCGLQQFFILRAAC